MQDDEILKIVHQIKSRQADFLKWSKSEGYRAFYRVIIFNRPFIVLFDFEIDIPVTVYHNSWLKMENGEWVASKKYRKAGRFEYSV